MACLKQAMTMFVRELFLFFRHGPLQAGHPR
jgi:hypothetical protein